MLTRRRCCVNGFLLVLCSGGVLYLFSRYLASGPSGYSHIEMELQHVIYAERYKLHQYDTSNSSFLSNAKKPGRIQHSFNLSLFKGLSTVALEGYLVKRFPKYIIIGFGKAGTKALYEALKLHPQLVGPEKEQRFFSLHYNSGLKSYLQSIPDPPVGGYTIEKSPDYIVRTYSAARIAMSAHSLDLDPHEMKFIVVLRNPIDRAMSEYIEWNVQRRLSRKPVLPHFNQMVVTSDKAHINSTLKFLNASCYAYHIRKWQHFFSNEQLCFVDGDMFVHNPFVELLYLERCLGLNHFYDPDSFIYDKTRQFYCFKDLSKTSGKLCMNKSKGRKHPDIPRDIYMRLRQYFHPWDEQLPGVTGRNFTQW